MGDSAGRRSATRFGRGAVAVLAVLAVAAIGRHLVASAQATARGDWVDGPSAVLDAVAVSPHDARVRAAVWHTCPDTAPAGCRFLVAVTRDGFATRTLVPLRHSDVSAGSGAAEVRLVATAAGDFLVAVPDEAAFLLHGDGTRTAVGLAAGEGPARPGEVVAWVDQGAMAIDPRTGAAHALPGGPNAGNPTQQADGRLLKVGIADPGHAVYSYQWSDDGGRTWRRHPASSAVAGFLPVPSARRDTVAFLQGRASHPMPLVTAVRGASDGSTWRTAAPTGPRMFVDAAVVLPDGRLVVGVVGGSERPAGPWVSAGADWSRFTRLLPPGPAPRGLRLVGSDVRPGHATLLVAAGTHAWAVEGGAWRPVRAR